MRLGEIMSVRDHLWGVQIATMQWSVAIFCILIGVLMLVAPHHFGPTYTTLPPHPALWAATVLLAGASLIGVVALAPRRSLALVAHAVVGAVLLAFAFVTLGGWIWRINYAALALGTVVAPLLPRARQPERAGGADLFTLVMGMTLGLTGAFVLLSPDPYSASAYRLPSRLYGVASLVSGLVLVCGQLYPVLPRTAFWAAHLLAAVTCFSFLVAAPLPNHAWAMIAYYGGFGAVLTLVPLLGSRLSRIDPTALETRLSLALVAATTLPLIVGLTLSADQEARSARDEALAAQQVHAMALAEHIADAVELHRVVAATLPAGHHHAGTDADAHATLQRFGLTYPDLVRVSLYDAAGDRIVASDDGAPESVAGWQVFEASRSGMGPSLNVRVTPAQQTVLEFGAPIRMPDGRFDGLVVGVFRSDRLVELLARAGKGPGEEAYLVDAGGWSILDPHAQPFGGRPDAPPVAALLRADAPGALTYRSGTGEQLAGYARVPGLGWGVVQERPADAALTGVRADNDLYFGLLLLFLAAAAALGALTGRWLTGPLKALSRAVRTLALDDFSSPLPLTRVTEVGQLTTAVGEMRDRLAARTAERERAEEERDRLMAAIERERAMLARIMASMSDGLVVIDSAQVIRYCNARAGALVGVDSRLLLGRPTAEAFDTVRRSFVEPGAVSAAAGAAVAALAERPTFEVGIVGPPQRDVSVQLFPVADVADVAGVGVGVGILLHDVTAERDLQRTKDELVSVVSHELRTPLATVVGFAELLLTREWSEADRRRFLTVTVEEGRRLTKLINDFLDLQRMEGGRQPIELQSTDLMPILERAVAGAGDDPRRPISLEVAEHLPSVQADAERVQQVLSNLLSNARKYSPTGGAVRVAALVVDGAIQVSVSDQGLGIPPEALHRVFEKFYRVDNSDRRTIKGTGLGLAITREIVETHGGRIWAESSGPGRGARFCFTLPPAADSCVAALPAGQPALSQETRA
jgi:signal transduction histidine kinase